VVTKLLVLLVAVVLLPLLEMVLVAVLPLPLLDMVLSQLLLLQLLMPLSRLAFLVPGPPFM